MTGKGSIMQRIIYAALLILSLFIVSCTPSHGYPTVVSADTTKTTPDGTTGASTQQ